MAGLDRNMLNLIKCLAKNQIQDAKTAALACLVDYSTEGHTQAETMDFLANKVGKEVLEEIQKENHE